MVWGRQWASGCGVFVRSYVDTDFRSFVSSLTGFGHWVVPDSLVRAACIVCRSGHSLWVSFNRWLTPPLCRKYRTCGVVAEDCVRRGKNSGRARKSSPGWLVCGSFVRTVAV